MEVIKQWRFLKYNNKKERITDRAKGWLNSAQWLAKRGGEEIIKNKITYKKYIYILDYN